MNNELQLFGFDGQDVRVVVNEGEPWFVAKDLCEILDMNTSNVANKVEHVPLEWKGRYPIATLGGTQEVVCLSEQGLYFFLNRSDKIQALPLQKWVAGQVLPSIRKHGGYIVGQNEMSREEFLAKAVLMSDSLLKEKDALIAKQEQELIEAQPKIESHDALMRNKDHMSITECAQHFNLHPRAHVLTYLREHGYLKNKDLPTQRAIDRGYLVLRENRIPGKDMFVSQAVVLKKQLELWRTKLVPRIMKEFDL